MQSNSTDQFKLENVSHRQPRFVYGPLLGLLLANFVSNSAIAKFAPLGAVRLSYEPVSWLPYNRPSYGHYTPNTHHDNSWQPVEPPYGPPVLPTSQADTTEGQQVLHYHISPPNQQQIVNINGRPPTAIVIGAEDVTETDSPDVTESSNLSSVNEDNNYLKTNIDRPHILEPVAAESLVSSVQQTTTLFPPEVDTPKAKSVKRGATNKYTPVKKSKQNPQKHRRYTTTPDYYYDSYEDLTTSRFKAKRKAKPKKPIDSYEDDTEEYEYDTYDITTKPYKKRRRTTTLKLKRNKNKRKQQKITVLDDYDNDLSDYDDKVEPLTQIVVLRQRQETTTTTETTITNGTTLPTSTTTTENTTLTGYGYGPSNGNENISITYGPPHGVPSVAYGPPHPVYGLPGSTYGSPSGGYYHIPFADWYSGHEKKKLDDITGFDEIFH